MTDADILSKVKSGLMITSDHFDDVLTLHINDVKDYLLNAGVHESVIESEKSVGAILRGVSDLWTNGSSEFSPYFRDRVTQLALIGGVGDVQTESN